MSYTSPAIKAARKQIREERMRQGLDRHSVNAAEVAELAAHIERLWNAQGREGIAILGREALARRIAVIGR